MENRLLEPNNQTDWLGAALDLAGEVNAKRKIADIVIKIPEWSWPEPVTEPTEVTVSGLEKMGGTNLDRTYGISERLRSKPKAFIWGDNIVVVQEEWVIMDENAIMRFLFFGPDNDDLYLLNSSQRILGSANSRYTGVLLTAQQDENGLETWQLRGTRQPLQVMNNRSTRVNL
jgi:hypothetical protein